MQPPRYEVQAGTGGMEVSLIAAPLPAPAPSNAPAILEVPEPEPQEQASESTEETPPAEPSATYAANSPYVGDGSSPVPGNDPTTLYLSGGAATGRGGRLRNPAPPYPYAAIRRQQQGLVILEAVIDKAGRPTSVEIRESSGFPLLDQSALRTVRRWKFDAAHIGFLPVQSRIVIPIRFTLDNRQVSGSP